MSGVSRPELAYLHTRRYQDLGGAVGKMRYRSMFYEAKIKSLSQVSNNLRFLGLGRISAQTNTVGGFSGDMHFHPAAVIIWSLIRVFVVSHERAD